MVTELTCIVCVSVVGEVFCEKGNEDEEGFGQSVSCFVGLKKKARKFRKFFVMKQACFIFYRQCMFVPKLKLAHT